MSECEKAKPPAVCETIKTVWHKMEGRPDKKTHKKCECTLTHINPHANFRTIISRGIFQLLFLLLFLTHKVQAEFLEPNLNATYDKSTTSVQDFKSTTTDLLEEIKITNLNSSVSTVKSVINETKISIRNESKTLIILSDIKKYDEKLNRVKDDIKLIDYKKILDVNDVGLLDEKYSAKKAFYFTLKRTFNVKKSGEELVTISDISASVTERVPPVTRPYIQEGPSENLPGTQLADITEEDPGRKWEKEGLKNGSIQREAPQEKKNNTDGETIQEEYESAQGNSFKSRVTAKDVIFYFPRGLQEKQNEEVLIKENNITVGYERDESVQGEMNVLSSPEALVTKDCAEINAKLNNKRNSNTNFDMEFNDKDFLFDEKTSQKESAEKINEMFHDDEIKFDFKSARYFGGIDKLRRDISIEKTTKATEDDSRDDANGKFVAEKSLQATTGYTSGEVEGREVPASTSSSNQKTKASKMRYDFLKKKTIAKKEQDESVMINNGDFESDVEIDYADIVVERDEEISPVILVNNTGGLDKDERWFAWHGRERERDTVIRFSMGPPNEKYLLPALKLSEGTFVFGFLSGFFNFLHPFDFPTELVRDVMWDRLSVPHLILQVEAGFIAVVLLAVSLSLVVPSYGLCAAVLSLIRPGGSIRGDAVSPPPGVDMPTGAGWKRRGLMLAVELLLLISLMGVSTMFLATTLSSRGSAMVRPALSATAHDLPAFLRTAHAQLSHVLLHPADQAMAAAEFDLTRADILLGEPIRKAIATETGIDVALDALNDITTVSVELSQKTLSLGHLGSRASVLASAARERLRELRRQLEVARRHCTLKDRPLCETVEPQGVELVIQFDMITEDRLQGLAAVLNARNLSEAATQAREHFSQVPQVIANQTGPAIEDLRQALMSKRMDLRVAERSLSRAARHLAAAAVSAERYFEKIVRTIDTMEFWRWLIFLVAIVMMSSILILQLIAIFCGCCGAESQAGTILKTSVVLMCLFSLPLWALAIVVFATAGHGEVFICRPLYDEPDYKTLSKLLDKPGLLYQDGKGFLQDIMDDLDNITINVPIREVLRECRNNRPSYPAFSLRHILDVDQQTAHYAWSAVAAAGSRLARAQHQPGALMAVGAGTLGALQEIMTKVGALNITDYRMQLNGPLTGKDLNSLGDQLESIANQLTDLTTSTRIETLASRTRRLVVNTIQPLETLRTELVFKLTELELSMQPYQRQLNQSLSHLKTIQYYVDNQGVIIAQKKSEEYVDRLIGYLEQYRGHVLDQVENHVARCGPLWEMYDSARTLVCKHYMDSLNGFWLGLSGALVTWLFTAPLALRLRRAVKAAKDRKDCYLLRSTSHRSSSENAAISEQSTWSTPGDPPPVDNWR